MKIVYKVKLADNQETSYTIDIKREKPEPDDIAFWTNLEFARCKRCPLDPNKEVYCPVALDVQDIVNQFSEVWSCDEVDCTVETEKRNYSKRCSSQHVLRSLLGLVMMSSSCPILSRMKDLSYLHIPFSTSHELFFQFVSYYLLNQYQNQAQGKPADFQLNDLRSIWDDFQKVTRDFTARIRLASETDASLNAMIALNSFSEIAQRELEDLLRGLKDLREDLGSAEN